VLRLAPRQIGWAPGTLRAYIVTVAVPESISDGSQGLQVASGPIADPRGMSAGSCDTPLAARCNLSDISQGTREKE
jgi:hypothetical protein